jgi:NAD(P)-dependent dehydrogenase (short-subunit alcohol dehydrogenase family)
VSHLLREDVTLLINDAGINFWSGFLSRDSVEHARSEMETSFFGPLSLTRAFAPVLAKNGGAAIINVLCRAELGISSHRRNVQRFQGRRLGSANWLRTGLRLATERVLGHPVTLRVRVRDAGRYAAKMVEARPLDSC